MGGRNLSLFLFLKSALKVARPCAFHFFMFTVVLWLWHSKIDPQGAKRAKRERDGIGTGGDGKELFFVCLPAAATISLIDICKLPKTKRKAAAPRTTTTTLIIFSVLGNIQGL